jgi:hypothetical protein
MNGLDLNNISNVPLGFSIVVITMGVIAAGLFAFFKKKEWILTRDLNGLQGRGHDKDGKSMQS